MFNTNANELTADPGDPTPGSGGGGAFGLLDNQQMTVGGITLNVAALGGLAPEPIGINGGTPVGMFYGDSDAVQYGIGVRGNGSWAINGNTAEALVLSFDMDVELCSIDLNGIGVAPNNNDRAIISFGGFVVDVFGNNTVNGTPPAGTTFSGGTTDVVTFGTPVVLTAGSTITLEGPNAGTGAFSLRNIKVNPVPEPALPFGFVGLSLVALRRRS